jgi:hypothetical protein
MLIRSCSGDSRYCTYSKCYDVCLVSASLLFVIHFTLQSSSRMNNELDECGRIRLWLNSKYFVSKCLGGLKKTTEDLSRLVCLLAEVRTRRPQDYEAETPATRPPKFGLMNRTSPYSSLLGTYFHVGFLLRFLYSEDGGDIPLRYVGSLYRYRCESLRSTRQLIALNESFEHSEERPVAEYWEPGNKMRRSIKIESFMISLRTGGGGGCFTTDGQLVSMSWYRAPFWDLWADITSCRNVAQWVLQVMLPSACSFIVFVFTVFRYMFRPTWPSSSV